MSGRLILQIYEADVPLTQIGVAKVIMGLQDDQLREVANATFKEASCSIPRYCRNKEHHHYNACIGGGICLAKKYKRIFEVVDLVCVSCDSQVIVDTLNYVFDVYYDGKYKAEWRKPRQGKRSRAAALKQEQATKKRGKKEPEEPVQAPEEIKQESNTTKDSPKKERKPRKPKMSIQATETGRVSGITPNESNVPKEDTKPTGRGKPRVKQGRPRNRKAEAA
jgi:hypothetical protein